MKFSHSVVVKDKLQIGVVATFAFLAAMLVAPMDAWSACSSHRGRVVFNEVFDPSSGDAFLELKTIDPGVVSDTSSFAGWKVAVYKNNVSTKTEIDFSSAFSNTGVNACGQKSAWIRIPDSDLNNYINGSNGSANLNFVLYETSGTKIVDILRLGAATSFYGAGTNYASCPEIETALPSTQYDAAWGSNGNKDWFRNPDGTGPWGGQATANNSDTECGNNQGGSAFSLTKVPNITATTLGANVTYTIYAQNGATGSTISNFWVGDNVPTGLSYVSCTAPTGGACGTVLGIPYMKPCTSLFCSLAAGTSMTGTFTFQTTATGTITNTATAYNGLLGLVTLTTDTASIVVSGSSSSAAANFDCLETSGTYTANPSPPTTRNPLYTKLTGTNFAFDVVALKNTGAVETNYVGSGGSAKSVTVELIDNTNAATVACASRPSLGASYNQTVTFAANNTTGRTTTGNFNVSTAAKTVACRVTDGAGVKGCSVDSFTIRPTALVASATASQSAATGTPIFKAGTDSFTMTATADATGYTGNPKVANAALAAHAGAVQAGALNPTAFSTAAATGDGTMCTTSQSCAQQAFTYDEVGNFKLNGYAAGSGSTTQRGMYDDTFTATDSANSDCTADYSNALNGGKYGCYFGLTADSSYFGRFIPDHFLITSAAATPGCSSSFTYFGQDGFTTPFTLTAQNAANGTTKNYEGSYAKLALTAWNSYSFATAAALPAGSVLSASATAPTGTWSAGQASVSAKHQISRPTAATGQTSVTITAKPVDSDGVTMASATAVSAAGTPLRFGRLHLSNAYGSELLDLPVMLSAQYYNGTDWVFNSADSCTQVSPSSVIFSGWTSNLAACETYWSPAATQTLSAGRTNLVLRRPGAGNNGSVTVALNVGATPSGSTCVSSSSSSATANNLPQFGTTNPSAKATFGLYKTAPLIDRRELY